ncbi:MULTISPECIES: hypothetical protein [unclassified Acinetobacter]|uniref:hypothetical protein n=1 Tax=unclassified Acinetobacter TaxID=196816 RepID=UPI00244CF1B7|nr:MULTISPECIES: hypothetical protein [unclassified Acinetobacter]MDH0030335.1 Lar family restriction alleviation protein [Acinetobacter sp. GD04021]MDH0885903.1 Lar family restriction alleviation protein [Acinetobacter sp. GD03873]MDH1082523.1 Lar family restriction alleviation protein [Acinetobacter sp. GD03983]MDH2189085.1 Lar family restriction alleviation protein [Acinetobacter sp. GD03645]MDH2202273.1 Lar family restriction alleviation protein [Acinetobacter sp. GD03647]
MGNRWHADQENNMRPDVVPLPCPWCGLSSVVTDTELFKHEYMSAWEAQSSCHECGAKGPDTGIARFPDHPLLNEYKNVDWEDEREVVNFAVQIWNIRK